MDFRIDIERDEEVRILQLTDMQVIDSSQQRTPDRLREDERLKWVPENMESLLFGYIRELVSRTKPDLIIITGDITYGEFDDNGSVQEIFTQVMDSFGIPWAPVYGNHDNETKRGIEWQNQLYENSKHCLFKKGSLFGNGNYSIGVYQKGEHIRTLFMMDSNGCGKLGISQGFREDQLEWLESEAAASDAPSFLCFHIPTPDFAEAAISKGYQPDHDSPEIKHRYILDLDVPAKPGDFGRKLERMPANGPRINELCRRCGIDGLFAGHKHKVNYSIDFEGVRYTLGLKTGLYDYHDPESLGGTLITLEGRSFAVRHEHTEIWKTGVN